MKQCIYEAMLSELFIKIDEEFKIIGGEVFFKDISFNPWNFSCTNSHELFNTFLRYYQYKKYLPTLIKQVDSGLSVYLRGMKSEIKSYVCRGYYYRGNTYRYNEDPEVTSITTLTELFSTIDLFENRKLKRQWRWDRNFNFYSDDSNDIQINLSTLSFWAETSKTSSYLRDLLARGKLHGWHYDT